MIIIEVGLWCDL